MANVTIDRRLSFAERAQAWFAEWIATFQRVRFQTRLRHELSHVDDHLLRDMGIAWTGRHYERAKGEEECGA